MNQFRSLPRDIVIAGVKKFALRIARPLVRKESVGLVLGEGWRNMNCLSENRTIQGCWPVVSRAEREMTDLWGSRIDFDKIGVTRIGLEHEV